MSTPLRTPRVAIVGAGVSGLCMGIKLLEAGIDAFTIYEKATSVGGTWRDNTYPGLFCDVPSRYYQFSFAPNPDWSRMFSPGPEIGRYLERVADAHGLRDHIAFGTELAEARWEDGAWRISGSGPDGDVEAEADFVVTGCGFLHQPWTPDLPGLETFEGAAFHSSRWDHGVDLAGKRVGVVGTGSTGVQIVAALGGHTRGLVQFARTPQWVFPMPNLRYTRLTRAVYRRIPGLCGLAYRAYRWVYETVIFRGMVEAGWQRRLIAGLCRANLLRVRDRRLRERLRPSYEAGCKRLVASVPYYRAVQREGVEVVADGVERVVPDGVVTADGRHHALDVLVLATGFDTHALVRPMEFVGPGGRTLSDAWAAGPRGYDTIAVPGLPNCFMTMGPNSPVNVSSMIDVAESQVGYAMAMIERWRRGDRAPIAPTQAAADRFNREVQEAMPGTIWVTGCQSWYLADDGTPEIWPWLPERHRDLLDEPDLADYEPV